MNVRGALAVLMFLAALMGSIVVILMSHQRTGCEGLVLQLVASLALVLGIGITGVNLPNDSDRDVGSGGDSDD